MIFRGVKKTEDPRRICFFCNRDGLFTIDVVKGIGDKESGYDDSTERREPEKAADMLFGKVYRPGPLQKALHFNKQYTTIKM